MHGLTPIVDKRLKLVLARASLQAQQPPSSAQFTAYAPCPVSLPCCLVKLGKGLAAPGREDNPLRSASPSVISGTRRSPTTFRCSGTTALFTTCSIRADVNTRVNFALRFHCADQIRQLLVCQASNAEDHHSRESHADHRESNLRTKIMSLNNHTNNLIGGDPADAVSF